MVDLGFVKTCDEFVIANFHGAPFEVCPERGSMGCCPHSTDNSHQAQMDFLPWHRLYLGI